MLHVYINTHASTMLLHNIVLATLAVLLLHAALVITGALQGSWQPLSGSRAGTGLGSKILVFTWCITSRMQRWCCCATSSFAHLRFCCFSATCYLWSEQDPRRAPGNPFRGPGLGLAQVASTWGSRRWHRKLHTQLRWVCNLLI